MPPNWGEEVELGVENGPIRMFNIGFLLVPHSDKALSLTVFTELSNFTDGRTDRQTDEQNWYSNIRPDAARYALASVAKMTPRGKFK